MKKRVPRVSSRTHPSHIHVHPKACQAAASIIEAATVYGIAGFNFCAAPLLLILATYTFGKISARMSYKTWKENTACKPDPVQIYFHTFHGQRFLEKDIVDVSIYKSRTQSKNKKNCANLHTTRLYFSFCKMGDGCALFQMLC